MSLNLNNLRQEITKHLRVLKRQGTVMLIGSDKDWSKDVKYGRGGPKMAARPFIKMGNGKGERRLMRVEIDRDGIRCDLEPKKRSQKNR